MDFVETILRSAHIRYGIFVSKSPDPIWMTAGNQLISSYGVLRDFAKLDARYRGWHAHHVFEAQDLDRIGASSKFPAYEEQLAVLLPETAHINRINSVLRNQAPKYAILNRKDLLSAYRCAYELMDDYCGGGVRTVIAELLAIVKSTLDVAGVA